MKRVPRRAMLQGLAAASTGLVALPSQAEEASVPLRLQVSLIQKLILFDRAFRTRSQRTARIVVVHKGGDSERFGRQVAMAFEEKAELGGLPASVERMTWRDPAALAALVRAPLTAFVYLSTGLEAEAPAVAAALAGTSVLTIGATGTMAERGACVGLDLVGGKPKIYVNLGVAKRQNVDFSAGLLSLVKVV
jgi:YfiR/HmsC-like